MSRTLRMGSAKAEAISVMRSALTHAEAGEVRTQDLFAIRAALVRLAREAAPSGKIQKS